MGKATIRRPKTTKADSSGLLVLGIGIALAAAACAWWFSRSPPLPPPPPVPPQSDRSRALLTAVRELRWATAMDLADQGAAPFRGLLSVSMAARSMASVRGNLSLAGVCSGRCSEDDGEEPAFEQWLTWLAAQRFDGWQADAADALFSAIRSRHLRGVEILCGGLRSEGIVSALRSTPLLQLAATTRAEVAAVSRILLLADREHVRRRRLLGWIATLRDLEPTAVEALLRDAPGASTAQGTFTAQGTSTAQGTLASGVEPSAGASGSAVRQAAVSAVMSS